MAPRLPSSVADEIDQILLLDPNTCLPSLAAKYKTSYGTVCGRRRKLLRRTRTGIDERKRPGPKPGTKQKRRTKETEPRKSIPRKRKEKIEPPPNMLQGFDPFQPPPGSRGINEVLENARSSLNRLSPQATYDLLAHPKADQPPAILIDIRPQKQRSEEGEIEGAVIVERNVLEWRLDPRSDARIQMGGIGERYDTRTIVFCSEGYTSSLAARSLQELGLWNATDLVGGYRAWREEGLGGVPSPERGGKARGVSPVGVIPPTKGHTGVS